MDEQLKQSLRDFVATSNSGKYKTEDELMSKFPEFGSFDRGVLRDFVATSNSGKYKVEDELFSKFPEFNTPPVNAAEKKNAVPSSAVGGPQQGTVTPPTVKQPASVTTGTANAPAQQGGNPPAVSGVPQQPQVFGEDLLKSLAEKPTEELLWNYIGNVSPSLLPKAVTSADVTMGVSGAIEESNKFKQRAGKELLLDLERVRNSNLSPEAKLIRSKELISAKADQMLASSPELAGDLTAPIAIKEDLVKSERSAREANPKAFSEVMDDRMKTAALNTDVVEGWNPADPVGSYKNKMLSTAVAISFDKDDPRYKESFLIRNLERLKSNPATPPEQVKRYEDEIKAYRTARIAETRSKIQDEEDTLASLEASGEMSGSDLAEARATLQAKKNELDGYLNPDKAAAAVYGQLAPEMKSVPGETPMEQMKNHLARLVHERNDLRKSISDAEHAAGIFADSERGKRLDEVDAQIRALTPVVILNESPEFTGTEETGFGESFGRSFMQGLYPKGWMQRPVSQQEQSQAVLQAFTQAGVDISQYNPEKLDVLNERSKGYGLGDPRFSGELLGGTSAFMIQAIPGGAAVAPLKIGQVIKGTKFLGRAATVIADAVESGLAYEASGRIIPKAEENLNFAAGALGGAGKAMFGLMPFLNKQGQDVVTNFIKQRTGEAVGGLVEETGNTTGEVWRKHGMEDFWKGMGQEFQTTDDVIKFIVSTMAMGAMLGSGSDTGRELLTEGQAAFEAATPEQQAQAQTMIDQIKNESVQIQKEGSEVIKQTISPAEETIESAKAFEIGQGGEFVETEAAKQGLASKEEMLAFQKDKQDFPDAYANSKNEVSMFRFRQENDLVGKPQPVNTMRGLREGAEIAGEQTAPTTEEAKPRAYDFDGTLFDNASGKLTPLGEEVKARIAAGEDITVVTAREGGDTEQIKTALGIPADKIKATGDEAKKGEVLDQLGIGREEYFDADKAKMDAIQGGAVEEIDDEWASILNEVEDPFADEATLTQKAKDKVNDSQNKQGIPGEVGVGQEPVQAQPVEGAGGTPPVTGGILQGEAVQEVAAEPVSELEQIDNRIAELQEAKKNKTKAPGEKQGELSRLQKKRAAITAKQKVADLEAKGMEEVAPEMEAASEAEYTAVEQQVADVAKKSGKDIKAEDVDDIAAIHVQNLELNPEAKVEEAIAEFEADVTEEVEPETAAETTPVSVGQEVTFDKTRYGREPEPLKGKIVEVVTDPATGEKKYRVAHDVGGFEPAVYTVNESAIHEARKQKVEEPKDVKERKKGAIQEVKAAFNDFLSTGAISDPEAEAKKIKRLIDSIVNLGRIAMEEGFTDFAAWEAEMLKNVSAKLKPFLGKVYAELDAERKASQKAAAENKAKEDESRTIQGQQVLEQVPQGEQRGKPEGSGGDVETPVDEGAEDRTNPQTGPKAEKQEGVVEPKKEEEEAPPGMKKRGAYKTSTEQGGLDKETADLMSIDGKFYNAKSRAESEKAAREFIEEHGPEGVISAIRDGNMMDFAKAVIAAKEVMKFYQQQAKATTDKEAKSEARMKAANAAEVLFDLGTRLGQGVEAFKGWAEGMVLFGPEFMIEAAQRVARKSRKRTLKANETVDAAAKDAIDEGREDAAKDVSESKSVNTAITRVQREMDKKAEKAASIFGFTKEDLLREEKAALKAAREALFGGGKTYTGIPVLPYAQAVAQVAKYGLIQAAKGALTFKQWAERMRKDLPGIDDDMLKDAWEKDVDGKSPKSIAESMAAAKSLVAMTEDKAKKAADPMRMLLSQVRAKMKGRAPAVAKKSATDAIAEAVLNAEKYADVWNEAREIAEKAIMAGSGTQAEKEAKVKALNDALDESLVRPFSKSQVERAVREAMKSKADTIKKAVASADYANKTGDEIAAEIAEATGLPEELAKEVAAAAKQEFDRIITKKQRQAVVKALGTHGKMYFDIIDKAKGANMTDAEWRDKLAEAHNAPTLTEGVIKELEELGEQIQEAPEGSIYQARIAQKAFSILGRIEGLKYSDFGWSIWYALRLSSPMTHARNIWSNTMNAMGEALISGIERGFRHKDPFAIMESVWGYAVGATKGLPAALDILFSGPVRPGKFEMPNVLETMTKNDPKLLRFLSQMKYVQRFLAAGDALSSGGAREMRAREIISDKVREKRKLLGMRTDTFGIRKEVNEILYGTKEIKAAAKAQVGVEAQKYGFTSGSIKDRNWRLMRYNELLEDKKKLTDPSLKEKIEKYSMYDEEVRDEMREFANYATYNYTPQGFIGGVANAINALKAKGGAYKALNVILPYVNVPANVFNQQLSWSPWAFARLSSKQMTENFGLVGEKRRREMWKGVIGSASMLTVLGPLIADALLGGEDDDDENYTFRIHGGGPIDPADKEALKLLGWVPYSVEIKHDNGRREFIKYDQSPLALPLTIAGTLRDLNRYKDFSTKGVFDTAFMTASSTLTAAFDRSFLTGMADFFDTMQRGESGANALQKIIVRSTTPVPNLIPGVTKMFDATDYKSESFFGKYLTDIPGLRDNNVVRDELGVRPDINQFGMRKQRNDNQMWEVFGTSGKGDPVAEFILKNGIVFNAPGKTTEINGEKISPAEHWDMTEAVGTKMYKYISSRLSSYASMPKSEVQTEIKNMRDYEIAVYKATILAKRGNSGF